MSDLGIIPADPHDAVRDRYRDLSCQDRPGDPNVIPDDDDDREPTNPVIFLAAMAVMVIGLAFIGAIQ